ncbi:WYL domain-containing protein [Flexithrix dorotheae]|uniref:phytanoyl-CoA dioxygenase family protein n=1 Tax=Flexithrix dorotheae TaxID=70993 RepID=UPI0003603F01|nr:WYL domain-containing protein [Flexithrix dorotheae]
MPVNRNALIRYKTIDKCLQNHYRKWTLDDLIDACSDALYEYEGIDKGVSKRTVQADIQMMRSDKLGYNAPIIVVDRKYYAYEDKEYSITNIPLTDQDLGMLSEAVEFLKQFQGFSHFSELDGMVQKLEDHIYSQKMHSRPVIDMEKNANLKGLGFLDSLYKAIIRKNALEITYQSFKARVPGVFDFHPYLLKEFRNRWFLIGIKRYDGDLLNLALDRIIDLKVSERPYIENERFQLDTYYKNAIGVSVSPSLRPEKVLLHFSHRHAPYVITKPFHHSQEVVESDLYGVTISLDVQHNFELEKEILAFGDGVKVLAPNRLKRIIKDRLVGAVDLYQTDLNDKGLKPMVKKLVHKGYALVTQVYSNREVKKMKALVDQYFAQVEINPYSQRKLLKAIPELIPVIFNKNLKKIIRSINPKVFLTKSIYFDKSPQANWYVTWHQDIPINVKEKITTEGFYGWTQKDGVISVCPPEDISQKIFSIRIHLDETNENNGALKVISGSHKKVLKDEEIQLITENSSPVICDVGPGGIQVMKPLILHASSKSKQQKRRRVIHLEFCDMDLPQPLVWAEKEPVDLQD